LSPKQNRDIPPLKYDVVYQLKKDFPELTMVLNGGVTSLDRSKEILQHVDGVMMGREAYHNPYLLAEVDSQLFSATSAIKTREEVVMALIPYINDHLADGGRLHNVTRHILGLFFGVPGARTWRRILSEKAPKQGADTSVLLEALNSLSL
jgi:tRNA-dihydrouridine synthase A